jgi:hypothetical protein
VLAIHHKTVKWILGDDLNIRKDEFQVGPHALNSPHSAVQIEVSRELFDFLEGHASRSLSNLHPADEIRASLDNPWRFWDGQRKI